MFFINHALQFKYPAQQDKRTGLYLMLVSVMNYFALVNDPCARNYQTGQ